MKSVLYVRNLRLIKRYKGQVGRMGEGQVMENSTVL